MRSRTFLLLALVAAFCTALPTLGAITGTVINSDGAAIGSAKVSLFAPETLEARRARIVSKSSERTPLASVTTNSNGSFSIDSPKGQALLDLRIEAAGYAPSGTRVVPDEDIGAQALTTAPMKSGTITANGKPVAGAVVVWIGGDTSAQATTDANGKYSVPDPDKWANFVLVLHPDYATVEDIVSPFLGNKKGVDRTLSPGVAVKGKVVAADGTTPVGKATILIDNWPVATSADDGTFTAPHARKEWQNIVAVAGDRVAGHTHATTDVTLKLAKASAIAGVVRDARTQQPVAGVEVRLAPPGPASIPTQTALTDAKGNYTLSPVTPAIYSLNAARPGFSTMPLTVAPTVGQTLQKNVYLNERARITGTVLDEDKRPVAGTHLTTRSGRDRNPMMMVRGLQQPSNAAAAPDGHYVLRSVEPGTEVMVEATKRALPSAHSAPMKLVAGEKKSGVTIVIPRGITFSGKVTDGNGKPLSGVSVDAADAENDGFPGAGMVRRVVAIAQRSGNDDQLVRSGTDGSFSMKLKEGKYDVTFKREGFAQRSLRAQEVNATSKPVEVKLDPGVEISGRISRAGAPVEGVNVTAISEGNFTTAQTMPDGTFRLADLTPGSYMLTANKQESFVQTMRNVKAPAADVNIELPEGGRISGRVVDKSSHQPVTSFQAGVSTSRGGGGMMIMAPPMTRQFTSSDGTFTLDNVPPGQTQLVVNAPGYTTGRQSGLTIEDGKVIDNLEIGLETGAKLTGRVVDSTGAPLSGVAVREDDMAGGNGRTFRMNVGTGEGGAVTDPNGEYTIDALESGEKTFTFNRNGYLTEQKTVNISSKENRLDVTLSNGQAVMGQVVSDTGTPIGEASVSASSAAEGFGGRSVPTDAAGNFRFEGLNPGHYTFTASKNGYAQGITRDFDIATGAPVRIVMKSGGIITGHVTGLGQDELSSATVTANGANGSASSPVDSGGNFRIDGSPTGTVRLSARTGQMFGGNARSSSPQTVQVEPGSSVSADIEFKSGTTIRGRVTRAGRPMANASVAFLPRGGGVSTRSSTQTDNSGVYAAEGLDDGTYLVQVMDLERLSPFATTYTVKGSGNFDIDATGSYVRGRVVDGSSGEPINGARVELRGTGQDGFLAGRAADTDSNGNFAMESVAAGTYTATVSKTGFGNDTRDVTVGSTDVDVQVKLSSSEGLTLRVVDGRDQRILAAFVTVYDAAGRPTDPGPFRMGTPEPIKLTLSPGTYRLNINAMGYASQSVTISVPPGERTIALTPGGTLLIHSKASTLVSARLMDSSGHAYPVSISGRGGFGAQSSFQIDPSPGATTLNNIAAGTYTLQVLDRTGAVTASTTVTINDGAQSEVAI